MKKLLAMVLSLVVVSSVAFAKPTSEVDFATMNKADSQFLFQSDAKVVTLDNAEMKKTNGKYGWWGALAGAGTGAYGYIGYSMSSHSFSWSGLGRSVVAGAASGLVMPTPSAVMWTARSHAAMFGGFTSGLFY
jgi:hypothetical protein